MAEHYEFFKNLKIGDMVKVKEDLVYDRSYHYPGGESIVYEEEGHLEVGTIAKVTYIDDDATCMLSPTEIVDCVYEEDYWYSYEMLEPVEVECESVTDGILDLSNDKPRSEFTLYFDENTSNSLSFTVGIEALKVKQNDEANYALRSEDGVYTIGFDNQGQLRDVTFLGGGTWRFGECFTVTIKRMERKWKIIEVNKEAAIRSALECLNKIEEDSQIDMIKDILRKIK